MSALESLAPLVSIMAAERTHGNPDAYADAYQEGLIAAWRVSESHPDASPAYVAKSARRGVVGVLRGRPMTGEPSRRGWQDAHDSAGPLEHLSDAGEWYTVAGAEQIADDPGFAAVESRADPALWDALRGLPERERHYVWLRFWGGLTAAEIGAELGLAKVTVEKLWAESIRPALREAVAA